MFHPTPADIIYSYGEYHPLVAEFEKQGVTVTAGPPSDDLLDRASRPTLLIFDDMQYSINEDYITDFFVKKSHHQNITVILVVQNLFEKRLRVARNNAQYLILMRAPNAALQIRNLGVQLFPKDLTYFLDSYGHATREKYEYLLLDLHASSPPTLRLRSHIFPDDDQPPTVYLSRKA